MLETRQFNDQKRIVCIQDMEQLHTFSHLINRTRRRDIGDFTTRKPETVTVHFTPQQQQLHDMVLTTQQNMELLLLRSKVDGDCFWFACCKVADISSAAATP